MLFQALDDKKHCVGVYTEQDGLVFDFLSDELSHTWRYTQSLKNLKNVEYADLYCGGKSLTDVCPEELKYDWVKIQDKLRAYYRAFRTAKISLDENCFFDLVPESFLIDYCKIKNQITQHVFETYEKPSDYDYLLELQKLVTDIRYQKLQINKNNVLSETDNIRVKKFISSKQNPYIHYNIFGGKTGRLTTKRGSFPIHNLDKSLKKVIEPTNDYFLEIDFNAAEIRMVLALLGKTQPSKDIHQWNADVLMGGKKTREQAKTDFFAWFYNPQARNLELENVYDKNILVSKYWDGECVNTVYNKRIKCDRWHAFNYLVQSSSASMVLRQVLKVHRFLEGKQSFISHTVHDNVVIDMSEEDMKYQKQLVELFSKTRFGKFKTNVKTGLNMGELEECPT